MPGLDDFQDGLIETGMWVRPTQDLLTGTTKPRIRVDSGQTGFYEGREFRTFKEYTIPALQTIWIKAVVPINVILQALGMQVDEGHVHLNAYALATETTPFTVNLPVRPANSMSATERPFPFYTPQVTFLDGGVCTTGSAVLLDVLSIKTSGISNQASTQESIVPGDRGVSAGNYYFKIENLSNSESFLIFKGRWEERP